MNLEDKNIEKKAREILAVRNKLFILDFVSKSKKSVRKEWEECSGLKKLDRNLITLNFLSHEKIKKNI